MTLLDLARSALDNARDTGEPATVTNPAGTHYRWRVTFPGARPREVCYLPEVGMSRVEQDYPGAIVGCLTDFRLTAEHSDR